MLNKVGSEKIPLPQAHMLFRFAVYRDSYLDTNPKIAIYRDTIFRGDTHPYSTYSRIQPGKLDLNRREPGILFTHYIGLLSKLAIMT